jgi:hypothetical protein
MTRVILQTALIIGCLAGVFSSQVSAQSQTGPHIQYGVRYNQVMKHYEVTYKTNSLAPANPPTTMTAQVFIVLSDARNHGNSHNGQYGFNSFTVNSSYGNGTWEKGDYINGPIENRGKDYFGVYLSSTGTTAIELDAINDSAILFTFEIEGPCPDELAILEESDPFYFNPFTDFLPNSMSLNINNNFDVLFPAMPGSSGFSTWNPGYLDNYTGETVGCNRHLEKGAIDFEAVKVQDGILLNWQAIVNEQTDYFSVERSADGKNWVTLDKQIATGTEEAVTSYNYTDQQPGIGLRYYRIRTTAKDANVSYSPVKQIAVGTTINDIKLYPNPATNHVKIISADLKTADISIYAGDGRTVAVYNNHDLSQGIDVNKLRTGTYQVKISNGVISSVQRLVVAH